MSKNAQFNFHPQFDLFCSLRARPFTICTTVSKSCAKIVHNDVNRSSSKVNSSG